MSNSINSKKGKIITILLIIFIIAIITICIYTIIKNYLILDEETEAVRQGLDGTTNNSIQSNHSNQNSSKLTIINDKSVMDDYWYYIVGTLENNSQNDYEEVLIQYIALDKDGYNLSTCSDIAYNLNSGETYSFKATCVTDKNNVAGYKLKVVAPLKK